MSDRDPKPQPAPPPPPPLTREAALAQALRANLKRRKAPRPPRSGD